MGIEEFLDLSLVFFISSVFFCAGLDFIPGKLTNMVFVVTITFLHDFLCAWMLGEATSRSISSIVGMVFSMSGGELIHVEKFVFTRVLLEQLLDFLLLLLWDIVLFHAFLGFFPGELSISTLIATSHDFFWACLSEG